MRIASCSGDFECCSWNELDNFIKKSSLNPLDDIWLYGTADYPCLAILLNGKDACVHYFLNDKGDMWQSVGYGDTDVAFLSHGNQLEMPADSVISLDKAIECAKQFYATLEKPNCIEWREL